MQHTIIFTRYDSFNVSDIAICEFESHIENGKKALTEAVTKWIDETTEGAEAYIESSEDFNIGDLACNQSAGLLSAYGVRKLKIRIMGGTENSEYFDKHLYNP